MLISANNAYKGLTVERVIALKSEGKTPSPDPLRKATSRRLTPRPSSRSRAVAFHSRALPQNTMPGTCQNVGPDKVYQVPQFWYNAIKWVSAQVSCFDIADPGIIK